MLVECPQNDPVFWIDGLAAVFAKMKGRPG